MVYCLLAVTYSRPAASYHVWRLTGRVPVCAVLVAVVGTAVHVGEEGAGWSQGSTEEASQEGEGREGVEPLLDVYPAGFVTFI